MKLAEHPTVKQVRSQQPKTQDQAGPLDADWLRQLVLDAGADDVGFVEINRMELDDQREDILRAFPRTKTLISYVVRLNREPIRTPARSLANLEFHHTGDHVNEAGRSVVRALEDRAIGALNPAMGFLAQEKSIVWALLRRKIRLKGPPSLLLAFGRCFPT